MSTAPTTTRTVSTNLVRDDVRPTPETPATRSRVRPSWAYAGIGSALSAIGAGVAGTSVSAVYDPATSSSATALVAAVAADRPALIAFHVLATSSALLLLVFAAGLHRRLRATLAADSLVPAVATGGLGVTAAIMLLGAGLDTEFLFFSADDPSAMLAADVAMYNHWIGTIPNVWVAAGLSAVAVAVAALRHRALPRWFGVVSLVLGGLTVLTGVSVLQYLASMPGTLWLLVVAIGFAVGDRAHRAHRA